MFNVFIVTFDETREKFASSLHFAKTCLAFGEFRVHGTKRINQLAYLYLSAVNTRRSDFALTCANCSSKQRAFFDERIRYTRTTHRRQDRFVNSRVRAERDNERRFDNVPRIYIGRTATHFGKFTKIPDSFGNTLHEGSCIEFTCASRS